MTRAHRVRYGKLQPDLYERLQRLSATDTVSITIVVTDLPGRSRGEVEQVALATLTAQYPAARTAIQRGHKPMDVADPKLSAQINRAYVALLEADIPQRIQPLAQTLRAQGFTIHTFQGLPAISTRLPKQSIQTIANRPDVGAIFLEDLGRGLASLSTIIPTNRVPIVWSRGYDGSGVFVATVETGNVVFTSNTDQCDVSSNNCFRHPTIPLLIGGDQQHATMVASTLASDHSIYKGMAPGAIIISAAMDGSTSDAISAVQWALQQGAHVVNTSFGWCGETSSGYPGITGIDWAYDYYAKTYSRLFVVSAGNVVPPNKCSFNSTIRSPGRGWNVLSVGSYDDQDTAEWGGDAMHSGSLSGNPALSPTEQGDREKPEVVAPGTRIIAIADQGLLTYYEGEGTSFSAPMVSGLGALLLERNAALTNYPEASRAIIMATATNDLDGPSGIPTGQDLIDGAGGINADLADRTASTRGATPSTPTAACASSCWWAEQLLPGSFESNARYYYFNAQAGEMVRIATSWQADSTHINCADSNAPCLPGQLGTDLNLTLVAPDNSLVTGGYSASWDNNYELIPPDGVITLPQTGTYRIRVDNAQFNDTNTFISVAWTKIGSTNVATATQSAILIPSWGASPGGVWQYTATGGWTLKNNGLPSGAYWQWIAADPTARFRWLLLGNSDASGVWHSNGSQVTMANGTTPALWYSDDSGATWQSITLPTSSSAYLRFQRVEFSTTTSGAWMLAGRGNSDLLWRGNLDSASTPTTVSGGVACLYDFQSFTAGLDDETVMYALSPGGCGWDWQTRSLGYVTASGSTLQLSGTPLNQGVTASPILFIERLPGNSPAVVGVHDNSWVGGNAALWGSSNYRSHQVTLRLDGNIGRLLTATTDGVYIGGRNDAFGGTGNTGVLEVSDPLGSPSSQLVFGNGTSVGFIRADRQTRTTVAALKADRTAIFLRLPDGLDWQVISIPIAISSAGLADRLEITAVVLP